MNQIAFSILSCNPFLSVGWKALNLLLTMKSLLLFAGILIQTLSFNVFSQSGIGFTSSKLRETYPSYPTSMAFGPDNKLYITQQDGTILRLTIQKNGPNDYQVTSSENILVVKNIPNHDDRGQQLALPERQITGILTAGTSTNPILYICSSDPRIGGGGQLGDVDLDTNSGTISKLTKNGSTWSMVHLVQGLPRSEENHAPNGLALDEVNNILYVAQGGNTNAGSPSNCFAFLTEYALSGAVLKIDLNQINNQFGGSYTLPTLDDPTRSNLANGTDVNDPYGGNDGRNQAKLVPGGPVQIYSPGYRNIFDLILTKTPGKSGRMYTIDNGANGGWGGYPVNEGLPTVNSNRIDSEPGSTVPTLNDDKVNNLDNLHHITGPGYYGGHPNPLRANPAGAGLYWYDNATNQGHFELNPTTDWPPYPVSMANPVESDFRNPGVNDGALYTWVYSTNGLAEYTSTAYFNGAMAGNLLAASWGGAIHRIELNAAGTAVTNVSDIFNGFGLEPLDIIAQGDGQQFPGTIWALTYRYGSVTVFEPNSSPALCSGDINNYNLDDDGDGYSNGDETLNGTNPCSAASKPNDYDSDLLSDRYDTDDDNDGVNDVNDKFALDVNNGLNTSIPLDYPFLNGNPGSGLFGVGHTGLMTNYVNNYADNFDPLDPGLIVGGAVGALSVPAQPGDAVTNNQKYAFQFGIPISGSIATFTLRSRLLGTPFFNGASGQQLGTQSQGIYFGTGDQNNYLKLVLHANSGNPGLQILCEQNGVIVNQQMIPVADILSNSQLDLFIEVNSLTGLVKCRYQRIGDANPVDVGQGFTVSGNLINLLQGHTNAVAIGLIASSGNKTSFSATWDYMRVATTTVVQSDWQNVTYANGTSPQQRHENGFVEVNGKFYLVGGRGINSVNIFDPVTKIWTNGAQPPIELNHFQAVAYQNKIYAICAFTGTYPVETPVSVVYIYDTQNNTWSNGPTIPVSRRRGSAGAVLYNSKFYIISGTQNGHTNGWVPWVDQFDPVTGIWTQLPDAPRARDHFHAGLINGKIYCAGGRRTSQPNFTANMISEVDVYDIASQTWTTPSQMISPRGAPAVAVVNNELIVAGGEVDYQNNALDIVEAYNPTSNSWTVKPPMNVGRHGSQLIYYGGNLYIAAGSTLAGGAGELSTMAFASYPSGPPANTPPTVAQVYPNQSVPSTQTSLVVPLNQIFADDGGVANLTFTVPNNTNAALISNTTIVGTQLTFTLSGTTGTGVITLRATDASNTFVQTTFQLTVTTPPANTPPTVAQVYPNQSVPSTQTSLVVQLGQIFADNNGVQNLTFTVPNNTNAALISNTAIVGTQLTFTLSGTTGTGVITLRATDASNAFVETTFQLQVTSATPTLTNVIRINSGGPAQTFGSETWVADQYFTGGTTYSTNSAISNTTQDQIYQTERYGNIQYHIPVTGSGTYAVDLHLAEIYFTTSGSRIFNINVENGQFVRNNLDMIQTYGSNMQAIVLRADNLNVTDGMIDIVLTTVVDNAKISGIAVGKYSTPPANTPPTVAQVYPNQSVPSTQTSLVVPLNQIFADDGGVANLTFTVPNNTNAALISNTAIVGTQLTFTLSGTTGTGVITLRATDASNAFVQTTFQLTVTTPPANTPPTVAQVYPSQSVPSTQTSLVVPLNQIFADDGGVANLTFTVPNNTNAALISNTAIVGTQLTFTLSGTTGTGVITLRATDASNTFVQTTFQLTVTAPPANTPPTVAQVYPNQSVPSTQTSLVVPLNQIFADDGGVANLTFTVPNNTNAALISNTAIVGTQLTFTLTGTTGTGVITLRATDASNLFVQTTFQLQVTSGTPTLTNVIRINSGGPAQTFGSETWVADQYFTGGTTYSTNSAISNTTQDQIYQTERYGNIQYHIPVTGSGTYAVDLHLAEIYFTTSGSRIFNINVENGQFVRNNLDMIQTYGSNMQAIVLRADNLNVTDGMIDIVLTTVVDNAKISGIAVGKYSTPPANTPPTVAQVYPNQSVPSTQTSLVVPLNQIFADDGGVANLTFTVPNNTNAALISNTAIVGTQLTFTLSGTTGTGVITLRATDASNTFVQTTFQLTVTAPPANTPPTVAQVYPNQSVPSTQTSLVVPLNQIFADDGGVANLTFTVPNNTNAALISNTAIVGTQLTFTLSGTTGTGVITLRATDASNLFVETTFQLQVTSGTPTLTNVIRINSGGPAQTFGSETWVADQYFTGGTTYSTNSAISNTTQDQIYQTERYGNIQYHIPVTGSGTYAVDLHLAEIYFTTSGSRIFNINVENGQFVRNNLDMIQTYGSNMQAIVLRADNLNVTDGMIDIVLTTVVDNAKISGIAVGKYTGGAGARIADASNTPLVTRPPDIILNEGQSWDYQVIASDPAGENLSYTSKNLPASLSLHKGTGVIKGTIEMNAGTFPVTLKVTNRSGLSTEVNFVVTVTDIPYEKESFGPRMVLYPNPAEREFSLKLEVKQRDSWRFILIDLTGKQLDLGSFELGEGVQVLDFDLAPFSVGPGLYFLSVGNRVGKKSIKVALK